MIPGGWDVSGLELSSSWVFLLPGKEKRPHRWDPGEYWDVGEFRGWPEKKRLLPGSRRQTVSQRHRAQQQLGPGPI